MTSLSKAMTERQLQNAIVKWAALRGWLVYHTYDSRRSEKGFPDLCMVRPPRLVFAELKSARGKVTEEQKHWLDNLAATSLQIAHNAYWLPEVYLWRPDDLDDALEVLR